MDGDSPNVFNPGQVNQEKDKDKNYDYQEGDFELTEDESRDKVRGLIFTALTNPNNEEDLQDAQYPPTVLTQLLEEELINEFKDSEKPIYKSTANNVVKRLTGTRFSEARSQLSSGEFPWSDFIKGKNPKPQRRGQTSRPSASGQQPQGARPTNPVNRTRGVRPPFAGGRGVPGPRGARGIRGARGGRGTPMMGTRGGLNQSVESPADPLPATTPESIPTNEENDKQAEEGKQQPAIQVPRENIPENTEHKEENKKIELETEQESSEHVVIPPMRQVENEKESSPVQQNIEGEDKDPSSPSKMPKTSHRRGQPTPGNHNAQPPIPGRGRGHRGGMNRGGRTPNFNPRPLPQNPAKQPERIEIHEDEIVHEGEAHVEGTEEHKPPIKEELKVKNSQPKVQEQRERSNDSMKFEKTENKNFEESENKKREAKAMFGKILFENEGSDQDNRSRGRSPNFSEGRYAQPEDEDSVDRKFKQTYQPKNSDKSRRAKTQRTKNDLNKSVDLYATKDNRNDVEPLITEPNNALNTSFGVENISDLQDGLDHDEGINTNKIFASTIEESVNRSKTPPVHSKRPILQKESNERDQYHKPIGANEDFIIEEPICEPIREDSYYNTDQADTPEINIKPENNQESMFKKDDKNTKDLPSPIAKNKESIFTPENESSEITKSDKSKLNKRQEMLYDDEEEENKDRDRKDENTTSTINKLDENLKSFYTPAVSMTGGNQFKSLNVSRNDQTVPISHTSSVRSVPDELERVSENLKAKKQEWDDMKKELEEKDNELQVQIQLNNTLKIELQNERMKNKNSIANKKLEAENKELWDIINQIRKEQESYKNSIFLTFKKLAGALPKQEHENENVQDLRKEDNKKMEETKRSKRKQHEEADRQEESKLDQVLPGPKNKHLEAMTQEMMNNAAGSGSNQEDYNIHEKNNEGEYDDELEYDVFEEEYNEEGTSGGNAQPSRHDTDYRRMKYDSNDNNVEAEDRVIQGNERRGRQKQSKKRRGHNKNAQDASRESGDDYEEEKNPGLSSSGIQSQQYNKREKGKQSQPFGRQSETPSTSQFVNILGSDSRRNPEGYPSNKGNATHWVPINQRHRQTDPRQTSSTGDSSYNQKQNRRKDQKLSAESGGTDFNQNPSTPNQTEEVKSPNLQPPHYQYEGTTQGSSTAAHKNANRTNVPRITIGQRAASPEVDQRSFPNIGINSRGNHDEDVLLEENEVSTPRRQEQLENESKKTSGASTPSRDGADTPTRKNFNEHQQQLGENKGFIHDLTASNVNRKYPIDRKRVKPQNNEGNSRNLNAVISNNTYSQIPFGDQIDFTQPLSSQNSYDEREGRRPTYNTGRRELDFEGDNQNYPDNNYWEREQEHQ